MGHETKITGVPVTPLRWFENARLFVFDIEGESPAALPKGLPAGGSIRYTVFATKKTISRGQLAEDPVIFQNQRIVINGIPSLTVLDEVDIPLEHCQGEIGLLCTDISTIAPPYTDELIKIEKIVIPEEFKTPRAERMQEVREFYEKRKHFDEPITVHRDTMILINGYRRYTLAQEIGIKRVPIRYANEFPDPPKKPKLPPIAKKMIGQIKGEPRKPVDKKIIRQVWESEDGRCEGCGRPMDQKLANVARVDRQGEFVPENLHLVCIDCFMWHKKKETPFVQEEWRLSPHDLPRLAEKLDMKPDQAEIWLLAHVRQFGVLVKEDRFNREFWLPGIGNFRLIKERQGAPHTLKVVYLADSPKLKIKYQARTRNLPKSKWIQPQRRESLSKTTSEQLPETATENEDKLSLTDEQKELLNIVLQYKQASGKIHITQAELAKKLNCSPPTAGKRINELEKLGILQKLKRGVYKLLYKDTSTDLHS
jgi:hypothetical protein